MIFKVICGFKITLSDLVKLYFQYCRDNRYFHLIARYICFALQKDSLNAIFFASNSDVCTKFQKHKLSYMRFFTIVIITIMSHRKDL